MRIFYNCYKWCVHPHTHWCHQDSENKDLVINPSLILTIIYLSERTCNANIATKIRSFW